MQSERDSADSQARGGSVKTDPREGLHLAEPPHAGIIRPWGSLCKPGHVRVDVLKAAPPPTPTVGRASRHPAATIS